ncbi:TatD family deoxyribonuclease [Kaistella flava (ex Peng et al. 2021)]|uniref:TatD family deoxyribonuclease n=1 Tax=Kaistella flava (ex Peng et al. 2021) TaxID=2038776 RepID=A0A7M2YCP2_9FLAO|nr:TatD family hydrolase [Kaistella flava (ex Peng et al. 2021)]QOW11222.1 TatD family deoxyribonuclease [Kaistella flava (ex Peng et al. 2021)]
MTFFDFHHHHLQKRFGIYNLSVEESPPNGFFSAGIHPNLSLEVTEEQFVWLEEVSKYKNCVAIGECGLDGLINIDDHIQEELFERQIELANRRKKPLIIHCVRRFSKLIHFQKNAKVPMIIHGFNKRKTIGKDLQKHDFYLSFGKSVLQNVNLQEFVKDFPIEKIFLETDAEDFDLELLYQKVADLKNLKIENLLLQIEENLKTFNIPHLK